MGAALSLPWQVGLNTVRLVPVLGAGSEGAVGLAPAEHADEENQEAHLEDGVHRDQQTAGPLLHGVAEEEQGAPGAEHSLGGDD